MKTNFRAFRVFIVSLLVGSIVIASTVPVYAQTISFSPTRIFFKGNPGETVSELITFHNSGKEPYEFVVRLEDWNRDSLGNKQYMPAATLSNSNASSIKPSSTRLLLGSKEKKSFLVSMTIPRASNSQTSNCMLFFTQINAKENQAYKNAGIGIRMSLELGVQLFYTPPEAKVGEVNFIAFQYQDVPLKRLAVKIQNTGEVNKDAFMRFEFTNKKTGEELKMQPIPVAIMPNGTQWVYCKISGNLAAGDYLVVAILDSGDRYNLKVAEKNIHVDR